MAPNRGIASHFAASKASISRATRSIKVKPVKDVATPVAQTVKVASSHPLTTVIPTASSSNDVFSSPATSSKPPTPKKSTPRRATRTRLRTPDEGEVDRILAENESMLQSSPSARLASSSSSVQDAPISLLGTPPATPRASRSSPLLEPTQTSPISVRTDPDTNKMYLLLNRSPSKPSGSSSSPSKRKMTTPPKSTSPSKTPRTVDGTPRRLITGEPEVLGTEEEDGLVLTPGRAKGTRVVLGSPHKSPLLARAVVGTPKEQALRRIVDEDEEGYITPRSVRSRPTGLPLPPMATQKAAALFRGATLPASSSMPSLGRPTAPAAVEESVDLGSDPVLTEEEVQLPEPKHALSTDLPLPSFYSSILTLHMALEHALVVHLATAGCATATLDSSSSDQSETHKIVRLPNLISYTALRPLVERSGGRRLGPTELRRLASVWSDFHRSSPEEVEEVRGLGFIISKTRSMDTRTGRRALDWGLGIELEIRRTVREKTPPTEIGFGGVSVSASPKVREEGFDEKVKGTPKMPSTPPPSSASERLLRSPFASSPVTASPRRKRETSGSSLDTTREAVKAREGMSVVAMWNNGLETRKAEVGRRLRERCARFHQLWLDEKGISVPPSARLVKKKPGSPSRNQPKMVGLGIATSADSDAEDDVFPREAIMGAGGLLTPSATRSGGRRVGKRTFHMDPSELDREALTSEDEEEGDLSSNTLRGGVQGKQGLLDEVSSSVTRTSSMPSLLTSSLSKEGEMPPCGSTLHAWHSDFPLSDPRIVRPIPLATLPNLTVLSTPHRPKPTSDPSTPHKPTKFIPPAVTLNTAGMTLRERIAAKEQLRRTASLPSLSSEAEAGMTPMQALSQRSLVSRLPELCSILFMLFSNGTSLSSNGITRSPTIPMQDLLTKLGKSVKVQLSTRECRQSLDVLGRIAPGFLVVIEEGGAGKEYVRMGNNGDTGRVWRLNEVRSRIAAELNGK